MLIAKPAATKTEPIPAPHPIEAEEVSLVYSGSTHDNRHSFVVQVEVLDTLPHSQRA